MMQLWDKKFWWLEGGGYNLFICTNIFFFFLIHN